MQLLDYQLSHCFYNDRKMIIFGFTENVIYSVPCSFDISFIFIKNMFKMRFLANLILLFKIEEYVE